MRFIAAFRFLTVIPLPFRREATAEEVGGSVVYFPVIGLIIGAMLAAAWWVLDLFVPAPLSIGLLIVSGVLVTGALHLDGFIDTCDGLAGNKTVEERWRVMRDSRVGAFGVVGAVLLLLVKYLAMGSLMPEKMFMAILVLMPVVGRWAMVYAIFAYPYARPTGLGTVFKQQTGWWSLGFASAFTMLMVVGLAWWAGVPYFYAAGLAIAAGVLAVTAAWTHYLRRKFAGLTGDSYGAVNEVAEVGLLVIVNLLVYNRWLWVA